MECITNSLEKFQFFFSKLHHPNKERSLSMFFFVLVVLTLREFSKTQIPRKPQNFLHAMPAVATPMIQGGKYRTYYIYYSNPCTESTKSPNQNIHGKFWQNRTKIAVHFQILVLCWKKNYNTWKVDGATPMSLGLSWPLTNLWELRHLHALRCIETRIDLETNRCFSNFPCQMLCQVPPVQSFWVSLHHSHPLSAYQYCWPVRLPAAQISS